MTHIINGHEVDAFEIKDGWLFTFDKCPEVELTFVRINETDLDIAKEQIAEELTIGAIENRRMGREKFYIDNNIEVE